MENRARPAVGAHWPAATPPTVRSMENRARPAAGAHWPAAITPNVRARVVQKIMNNLSQGALGHQSKNIQLHNVASRYEAKVFSQSNNAQDYFKTISKKMMGVQLGHKRQPAVQAASDHRQQQAQVGRHQMRPVGAVLANSSAARMPQTASAIPLPAKPPQAQNMRSRVNQARPAKLPPAVAPAAVAQAQTLCQPRLNSTQQPQPNLTRMNNQDPMRMKQRLSYQTQNGQPAANVAIMQTRRCGGQNGQQFGNPPQLVGEVDWREDIFQKITSLKDAHWSELMEFARSLKPFILEIKASGRQLESLPEEKAARYRYALHTIGRIKAVLSFLQTEKTNISEATKHQLGQWQNDIRDLLSSHRKIEASRSAAKNARCQSQDCGGSPQAVSSSGATDNSQQKHDEQHAAESLLHSSENAPAGTPPAQQENHSDNLAGEAEDNTVRGEAESLVSVNLPGDTAAFTGGKCSQEIQQRHPADEAIPQLTQTVEPDVTSPAQEQTHSAHSVRVQAEDDSVQAEAERPVSTEALIKRGVDAARSLSPVALRSLASDMGVNLKRAFRHTTPDTMDDSSCVSFDDESSGKRGYKRQKTHYSNLPDEIGATYNMLAETEIRISDDNTGGADRTVIELCYNAVSLTVDLKAAICASEISTKLLVPADYPRRSPVILGEPRNGVPGVVNMAFRRALGLLPEPRSIEEMAKAWDSIVRRSVMVFAHRVGGGTFSTRHCIPV